MAECECFQVEQRELPVRAPISPNRQRQAPQYGDIAYCTHKHSPLTREAAVGFIVPGELKLKCGGLLSQCQVPKEQRDDV